MKKFTIDEIRDIIFEEFYVSNPAILPYSDVCENQKIRERIMKKFILKAGEK